MRAPQGCLRSWLELPFRKTSPRKKPMDRPLPTVHRPIPEHTPSRLRLFNCQRARRFPVRIDLRGFRHAVAWTRKSFCFQSLFASSRGEADVIVTSAFVNPVLRTFFRVVQVWRKVIPVTGGGILACVLRLSTTVENRFLTFPGLAKNLGKNAADNIAAISLPRGLLLSAPANL